ncbi:MAG: ferritin-like domain-containing protein [Pseudomonadota bacterium]
MAADGTAPIRQITKDEAYNAVAPDDFAAMLELDRHETRSDAFDKIISATHDHFWDPLDTKYIDFDDGFDVRKTRIMPEDFWISGGTETVRSHLKTEEERIYFANEQTRWSLSSILHGEQGALNLSASLCHVLRDPGAQEYAANQCREEARHVTGFAKYIRARWGAPMECGDTLKNLLIEIVHAPEVYKKIVGMQMLIEGLAMGAFAGIFQQTEDPTLRKLMQLVMTDEAFHHKFGKIWADRTIPKLSQDEHDIVEDWAAHCFQTLLFNLAGPHQQRPLYDRFGINPDEVAEELKTIITDDKRREQMQEQANIFRVLVKTLWNAGIITDRTAGVYSTFVNLSELADEGDRMVGDDIAEEGLEFLRDINQMGRGSAALAAE